MAQRSKTMAGIRLGRRVKSLRRERGMEQADLAAALPEEASRSLISYIETGRSFPTPKRIEEFAQLFEVDIAAPFLDSDDVRHRLAGAILGTDDEQVLALIERVLDGLPTRISDPPSKV